MLRLTVAPQRDSVLVAAQLRDRSGNAADGSEVSDTSTYGAAPQLGYAAQPSGPTYPLLDIDRDGSFDSILKENDVETDPALPAFYEVTQDLSTGLGGIAFPPLDPDDASQTLWLYVGKEFAFESVYFQIAIAGSWTAATLSVQYWTGIEWANVPDQVNGSRLDDLAGLNDQISWSRPDDWFPCTVEHSQLGAEGSRAVVGRHLFWVRIRLHTIVDFVSLPALSGLWEGEPTAEADSSHWINVIHPHKLVLARSQMVRDANAHLSSMVVVSRKQPATLAGIVNLGCGDYYLTIPTYAGDVSQIEKDPDTTNYRLSGTNKNGAACTLPIPAEGMLTRPGRYRARVYAEIPNRDASVFAAATGHQPFVPDPDLIDPQNPESQFDPTWNPVLTAAVANFDVRAQNTMAMVEVQRSGAGADMYTIWLEEDRRVVPLVNQGSAKDYARLIVVDASTGSVIVDTMNPTKCASAGPLTPMAGVSGFDTHAFRYTDSDAGRKLADRSQYYLFVQIVRNGEHIWSRLVVDFFA